MQAPLRTQLLQFIRDDLSRSRDKFNPHGWPSISEYRNSDTKKYYKPHKKEELDALYNNGYRYQLCKGGEGGGKSVWGIIKTLEFAKYGVDGAVISPDLPHFARSLWPEFRRWCPWDMIVSSHRRMESFAWYPTGNFELAFVTGSVLYMGGANETDPKAWEGANVTFAHYDEARRHKTPIIFKTLDGRVRVPGPNGIKPQLFITTTPIKNWLYDYFGPAFQNDPHKIFKEKSQILTLLTIDNKDNLAEGYIDDRRAVLSAAEARVLLEAEWEDVDDADHFLPSLSLWDALRTDIPPLKKEPMIIAADAGMKDDNFGIVGVTRHWERPNECAIRFVMKWEPHGTEIDFDGTDEDPGPFRVLKMLKENYNIVLMTYDPHEMHYLASRMKKESPVWLKEFSQQSKREEADRFLYDMIINRRLWHDGDPDLRQHISNADRKLTQDERKMRIVKRSQGEKIDLTVALSMAVFECMRLNI